MIPSTFSLEISEEIKMPFRHKLFELGYIIYTIDLFIKNSKVELKR